MKIIVPGLLLLLLPMLMLLWRYLPAGRSIRIMRSLLLILLVLIAAGFCIEQHDQGSDLIVVADRSLSMSREAVNRQQEIIDALAGRRGRGDRLGVVAVGRNASLVSKPVDEAVPSFQQVGVDPDASDLAGGITLALSTIPRHRPARLLVLSDGRHTGASPIPAAFKALVRKVPIDFRIFAREQAPDVAIDSIQMPDEAPLGTPFQIKVMVFAEKDADTRIALSRGDAQVAEKLVSLTRGLNQVTFRDLPVAPGILKYQARVVTAEDPRPENNAAGCAVEIKAPKKVLLVNQRGEPGNLARALTKARIPVTVVTPDRYPDSLSAFVPYRVVILENVPTPQLPAGALTRTGLFVKELGGGLLVTGGQASFGTGGYYLSALDPLLPVTMELKQEHRKLSVAMVIALDRSGSMGAQTPDGKQKMDLANLGTCAAIDLLGPGDQVAVVAVDSAAHLIIDLVEVSNNKPELGNKVRKIRSMGGGIMTDTALDVAIGLLSHTDRTTRHMVLFADAADAEEMKPGNCAALVDNFIKLGATVSVIGLGTDKDSDAGLLNMIAERTGGRVYYSNEAKNLPEIFAMETITVSRSGYVKETTPTAVAPDINLLGEMGHFQPPLINGYNLTYLKPGASCGILSRDEYQAPILAFHTQGLGKVAALTTPADGKNAAHFLAWPHYGDCLVSVVRYLFGESAQGLFVAAGRQGNDMVVTVEVDPEDNKNLERLQGAQLNLLDDNGARLPLSLRAVKAGVFEARAPLTRSGITFGSIKLSDGRSVSVPPVSLPYSPEYRIDRDPGAGRKLLQKLARISGGQERLAWQGVFSGEGGLKKILPLVLPLLLAVLALHLAEIAFRRLGLSPALLWQSLRNPILQAGRAFKGIRLQRQSREKVESGKAKPPGKPATAPQAKQQVTEAAPAVKMNAESGDTAEKSKPPPPPADPFKKAQIQANRKLKRKR